MAHRAILASITMIASSWLATAAAQQAHSETHMTKRAIEIPDSIRIEHEAIHSALVAATSAQGRVSTAARALAEVLHPHFVREEEIALPPLGLLAPLAAGEALPEAARAAAAAMTNELRSEMPRMLEEHARIRDAVAELRAAAEAAGAHAQVELADQLALHARTEDQVLYPAALLVGELIRSRQPFL